MQKKVLNFPCHHFHTTRIARNSINHPIVDYAGSFECINILNWKKFQLAGVKKMNSRSLLNNIFILPCVVHALSSYRAPSTPKLLMANIKNENSYAHCELMNEWMKKQKKN
jgi:hypothetical protein